MMILDSGLLFGPPCIYTYFLFANNGSKRKINKRKKQSRAIGLSRKICNRNPSS